MSANIEGGLHHIALVCDNFEESLSFYQKCFDFIIMDTWCNGACKVAWLEMSDQNILEIFTSDIKESEHLKRKDTYKKEIVNEIPAGTIGSYAHIAISCENVKEIFEKSISLGAIAACEPFTCELGEKEKIQLEVAFVIGISGEVIELASFV